MSFPCTGSLFNRNSHSTDDEQWWIPDIVGYYNPLSLKIISYHLPTGLLKNAQIKIYDQHWSTRVLETGGCTFNPSSQRVGMMIPHIWKNRKIVQTTRRCICGYTKRQLETAAQPSYGIPCFEIWVSTSRDVWWLISSLPAIHGDLVGGWATPLKNMSSSIGMIRNPILMGK